MRVMLVATSGGHLAQLLSLDAWWSRHDRHWVTFDEPHARGALRGEQVTWAYGPTNRNLPNAFRNVALAFRVLRAERPDVVVSTGAGVAAPFFLAARMMGIRTVYIEVFDRVDSPTLTGKLCYPLADLFCTQWEAQERIYPGAVTIGPAL